VTGDTIIWAREPGSGTLFTVDADGNLFSYLDEQGWSDPLARIDLAPVGPMAATFDGRIFCFAGEGISRLYCRYPGEKTFRDLGVAVSTLERRRYGYHFGDAVTGRDGEIMLGENDDLGHLWLYFPRIWGGVLQ
jgi:hypothetical protein